MFAFQITASVGLPLIFLFVMVETAGVLPMSPGEVAAISGGIEAADHKLQLVWVIAVAASGAIVGDNIGYLIGRIGGRRLLERRGPFARQRRRTLELADPFFERHGGKAVFYGRWLPVLRVFASWFAGGTKMRWRVFFPWNALGGITWALSMVLLGYYVGAAAKTLISDIGTFGLVVIILCVIVAVVIHKRHKRRSQAEPVAQASGAGTTLTVAVEPGATGQAATAQATIASARIPTSQATQATPVIPKSAQATVVRPRRRPGEGAPPPE